MARPGYERFIAPTLATQRRYEALRAYWVEELSPGEIAERFGYTKASVQTLISTYRDADLAELFAQTRPGPKRQPKKDAAREKVIKLRRQRHGTEEIVAELERAGTPLSRTAVWEILREVGLSRMPVPPAAPKPGPAPERLGAAKVRVLEANDWPETGSIQTQHAGLFLLIPDLVALDLPGLVKEAGWPSTSQLSAVRSVLALMALKHQRTHGQLPKLLVFDQKLTTQEHLAELDELGVGFITLRQRSPKLIAALKQLPASAWTKTRLDRSGKHKTATYHQTPVTIKGRTFRQIAVNGLGRDQATLILTNQHDCTVKQLIERYGQRWGIENQLAEQIRAFHLDSLCSQVPLAVDFDVALTVLADIVYRRFARGLHTAYHNQTPDTIREYLINGIGELRLTPGHVEIALRRRTHTPALLDAGYENRRIEVPWWAGRTLSYSFPAR